MNKKILALIALIVTVQLMVLASAVTISSVDISPREVSPGNKINVQFSVENTLNDIVENVNVALDLTGLPFAPYQSSNQASVDDISEGKSYSFAFDLLTNSDAESGSYKIPVIMSYNLGNERKETRGIISVIVNALPKLGISTDKLFLVKGQEDTLNIKITNSGLGKAKLLSIQVSEAPGIKFLSSMSVYVGNIDSDDFDNSEFKVLVNANSPSNINVPIQLTYSDSRNNIITESKEITIKAYSQKEAISLGLVKKSNSSFYVAFVIILVLAYVIYRNIKKRLKKKNQVN